MTLKQNVLASLIWGFAGLMLVSCGAEEDTISPVLAEEQVIEQDEGTQAIATGLPLDNIALLANSNGRDLIRGLGIGGPMGFVYSELLSSNSSRTSGVLSSMREIRYGSNTAARMAGDCHEESFTQTDNSFEYILDFGDGCEIDGVLLKGRIIETGTFTGVTFDDRLEFNGFGGDDWELSGVEVYSGTWTQESADAVSEVWEAAFTYSAEITETYIENGETYMETISASGEEVWNQDGQTILSGSELTTSEDGDTYFTEITSPLVGNSSCDDGYQYISGGQSGTYTEVDEDGTIHTSTFSIDFGDGACDNLIAVTENGVTETFDISEEWELDGSDSFDEVLDEIIDGEEDDDPTEDDGGEVDDQEDLEDDDAEDSENEEDDNNGDDQEDGDLEDQDEEDDLNDDEDSEQDDQDDLEDDNNESEDNNDTENEEGENDNDSDGEDHDLEDQEDDDIEDDLDDTEEDDQDDLEDEDAENDQEDGEDDDLDDEGEDQDEDDSDEDGDDSDDEDENDEDENDEDEDQGNGGSNG